MIYNADCLKVLKDMPTESVDLMVTDCPYRICNCGNPGCGGMLSGKYRGQGRVFEHNDIGFTDWLPECYRVLKNDTHAYIMINPRNLKDLQVACENTGFRFQQLLIWDKGNVTPNRWYMNSCELILMVRKGKAKPIADKGTPNILRIPNVRGKVHPTEKPVELMEVLIKNSSQEGDTVLDPFMGCGSTIIAAEKLNRNGIGIEIDPKYYEIAEKRLQNYTDSKEIIINNEETVRKIDQIAEGQMSFF